MEYTMSPGQILAIELGHRVREIRATIDQLEESLLEGDVIGAGAAAALASELCTEFARCIARAPSSVVVDREARGVASVADASPPRVSRAERERRPPRSGLPHRATPGR